VPYGASRLIGLRAWFALMVAAGAVLAAQVAPAEAAVGPTITGTAQQGQTLTVDPGSWAGTTTGYVFQWEDCDQSGMNCSAIAGATSQTYTLAATDVGMTIVVVVWNGFGSSRIGPEVALPTAIVLSPGPINVSPPQIEISHTDQYSVVPGTWTGDPTGYAYQWLDCSLAANFYDPPCTAIVGATGMTYSPTSGDDGFNIAVEEWATNALGTNGPVRSRLTPGYEGPPATVAPPPAPVLPAPVPVAPAPVPVALAPAPVAPVVAPNGSLPSITGAAIVGSTLTASNGSWVSTLPLTYSYQWERCESSRCSQVPGATQASYALTAADAGDWIQALVTATNSAGSTEEASVVVGPITQRFAAASVARFKSSLSRAIVPARNAKISRILRTGVDLVSVASLAAGKLSVTWTVHDHGVVVQLASGIANVATSANATIRLALSRRARQLLRTVRTIRVRAHATLAPIGASAIETTATFILHG
jgi:hypothetical protein